MNVLFITGPILPLTDANTIIMTRLANEMIKHSPKLRITFLGTGSDKNIREKFTCDEVDFVVFKLNKRFTMREELHAYLSDTATLGMNKRVLGLIKRPDMIIELLINRMLNGSVPVQYAREVKHIIKCQQFDILIGVSAPFQAPYGVVKAKIKSIPFIYYQLDPYSTHYLHPDPHKGLVQEEAVCKKAIHIIMTELIKKDYENSALSVYLKKTSVLPYPAFEERGRKNDIIVNRVVTSNKSSIHLLFVGSLYGDIRSPLFVLKLVYALKMLGHDIVIDFIGPILHPLDNETMKIAKALEETATFHGKVSYEQAQEWIEKADILVNIANSVPNQMPSKIFEYFSSGKPILNLYKIEKCPTLPYMDKYPYSFSISETQPMNRPLLDRVWLFLTEMRGKELSYHQVREIFSENTVQSVSEEFLRLLSNIDMKIKKEKRR